MVSLYPGGYLSRPAPPGRPQGPAGAKPRPHRTLDSNYCRRRRSPPLRTSEHCAGFLTRTWPRPFGGRGRGGGPEDGGGGGGGVLWSLSEAPLTGSRRRSTYLASEGPRRAARGGGDKHLAAPISIEEPGPCPMRARKAETGVGCRRAVHVADAERLGPRRLPERSGPPRRFPRAVHRGPWRRREDAEGAGGRRCRPAAHAPARGRSPGARLAASAAGGMTHILRKGDSSSAVAAER